MKRGVVAGIILVACLLADVSFAKEPERKLLLDFDNVDLKLVVQALGELTGKNFVYDDSVVKGTVTVRSTQKVSGEEAYRALESILAVKGLVAVAGGEAGLVKILPRAEAKQHVTDVRVGKQLEGVSVDDHIYTQVVHLEYADAREVWRVLSPYIAKDGNIIHIPDTNTLIITDSSANIYRLLRIIQEVDRQTPEGMKKIYVVYLENADPEALANILMGLPVRQMEESPAEEGQAEKRKRTPAPVPRMSEPMALEQRPTVVADLATSSLVITALPRDYAILKDVIGKLDVPRSQVLVEALIAEVSLDRLVEFGVEWATTDQPAEGKDTVFGGTSWGTRTQAQTAVLPGLSLGLIRDTNVAAILYAYRKDTGFNILSAPYIIARDNEKARILIGENIPYVKESRVTELDPQAPTVIKTFEYRDVGIQMEITPHINPKGSVRMEVHQLIETLLEGPTPDTPKTAKREIENTLDVPDGGTAVIGGLVRKDKQTVVRKVPILGDLPLLKYLFRTTRVTDVKTSLLVFITPHVVRTTDQLQDVTEKKRQESERAAAEVRGEKGEAGKP